MGAVFMEAIEDRNGTGKALIFFLRELKDLPGSLLRWHWLAIRKEKVPTPPFFRIKQHQCHRSLVLYGKLFPGG